MKQNHATMPVFLGALLPDTPGGDCPDSPEGKRALMLK